MTYFAFVSHYFQDQSINIVGFDLYVAPFFMLLLDTSCVLLSYVTSYNRLLDATFFHSFPPVTCYSCYVPRGEIVLLCAANSGQKGDRKSTRLHSSHT